MFGIRKRNKISIDKIMKKLRNCSDACGKVHKETKMEMCRTHSGNFQILKGKWEDKKHTGKMT